MRMTTAVGVPHMTMHTQKRKLSFRMTNSGSVGMVLLSALLVSVLQTRTTSAFVVVPPNTFSHNQQHQLRQQVLSPAVTATSDRSNHHNSVRFKQSRYRRPSTSIAISAVPSLPSLFSDILLEPHLQEASSKLVDVIPPDTLNFLAPYVLADTAQVAALLVLATAITFVAFVQNLLPRQPLVDQTTLASILAGTFLQGNDNLICVYRADRDGWSAIDFHKAVDGQGSGLVVAQMANSGKLFGGFNPAGWRSTDDYYSSSAAFLWTLPTGQAGQAVVKFPVLPGGSAAIFDYATAGPCFGAADLMIGPPEAAIMGGFAGPDMEDMEVNAGNLKRGKSSVGLAYDADPRWPAKGKFRLSQVEVYCNDYSSTTGSRSNKRGGRNKRRR